MSEAQICDISNTAHNPLAERCGAVSAVQPLWTSGAGRAPLMQHLLTMLPLRVPMSARKPLLCNIVFSFSARRRGNLEHLREIAAMVIRIAQPNGLHLLFPQPLTKRHGGPVPRLAEDSSGEKMGLDPGFGGSARDRGETRFGQDESSLS